MKRYNKIYVVAPRYCSSGGVELAHQLVDYLRNKDQDAYIVYEEKDGKISNKTFVTKEYKNYNIAVSVDIEDYSNNILVLPEMMFEDILKYHKIQIGCWWMSVDNRYAACYWGDIFFRSNSWHFRLRLLKKRYIDGMYKYKNTDRLLLDEDNRIMHFYQSHYAQHHLYDLGVSKVMPLSDYINNELIKKDNSVKKENIILYNPKKGYDFTKRIINSLPNYDFLALEGLNRTQLNNIFDKAKLYIDFGSFPGKDRLPREAVMHDCCIITGKNGASFFYEDFPLRESYKFDSTIKSIEKIRQKIIYILNNYDECLNDFTFYKKMIGREKYAFFSEIDDIFIQ